MALPGVLPAASSRPVLRSPADITLSVVFAELNAARAANEADRGTPRQSPGSQPDRLLACLEACVKALTDRHLPIPPALRDEFRLRRRLWSERR